MLRATVKDFAILHSDPNDRSEDGCVIIMYSGLGGTKESSREYGKTFMQAGHAVILADHYNEGQRRDFDLESMSNREGHKVCQKKHFWKVLCKTADDVPSLIDFAITTFGTNKVAAYGESCGGDILLTALVFERRLCAVVAETATPDWLRPNSMNNVLGHDEDGDLLYQEKCPCKNLDAFKDHPAAIMFITGDADRHVPGACAEAFVENLRSKCFYQDENRLQHISLPSCGSMGHAIIEDTSHRANAFISAMVGCKGKTDTEYNSSSDHELPAMSKVTWPKPAPLIGVKSRKKVLFSASKSRFEPSRDQTVNAFSGLTLTLESRIAAIGETGCASIGLLLNTRKLVTGIVTRHDGLTVGHLGPHLLETPAQSIEEYLVAMNIVLEQRPQVVILDEAATVGNKAWSETFMSILGSEALHAFRGAVVICVAKETTMVTQICTQRWTGNGERLWQEDIKDDGSLDCLEDQIHQFA